MQLWERGHTELRPGVGPAGLYHVVVIDLEDQAVVQDRWYRGTIADPRPLSDGQLEVTWSEGGQVRIIGSEANQRWKWSQPRATWQEGGYPPEAILRAIFVAMG